MFILGGTAQHLETMVTYAEEKMAESGVRLLWGTANLFTHRRFMAGAATNPDPEVFAYAAADNCAVPVGPIPLT